MRRSRRIIDLRLIRSRGEPSGNVARPFSEPGIEQRSIEGRQARSPPLCHRSVSGVIEGQVVTVRQLRGAAKLLGARLNRRADFR